MNWSANDSDKEEPEPADDGKYLRVPKNPISKKDPYKPPGWLPPLIPAEKVEVDWDINTDEPSTQQDSDGRRPNDGGRGRNDGGRRPNNDVVSTDGNRTRSNEGGRRSNDDGRRPSNESDGNDDEEDETLSERLMGLTEMFPESVTEVLDQTADFLHSNFKKIFWFSRQSTWIVETCSLILLGPIFFLYCGWKRDAAMDPGPCGSGPTCGAGYGRFGRSCHLSRPRP